ncbi:MAG: hypothetical protein ACREIA_18140 [Opitutaceae bacterium]
MMLSTGFVSLPSALGLIRAGVGSDGADAVRAFSCARSLTAWACVLAMFVFQPLCASGAKATAEDDLYAPMAFQVVDPEATVALFAQTGELVPVVIRRKPAVAAEAVAQLSDAFARTRANFLDGLEEVFGDREVGSREINSARFRTFRNDFQAANPRFPVNLVLAQSWAKGYSGDSTLDRLTAAMRQVMDRRLIGRVRPASTVFLAAPSTTTSMKNWGEVAGLAKPLESSELISVDEAGLELRRMLDALDRVAGGFLSGLLQPNFVEDEHLTALLLRERLGDRVVSRHYLPGELIVGFGRPIGRWEELALRHLDRIGAAPDRAPQSPAVERAPVVSQQPSPDSGYSIGDVGFLVALGVAGGAVVIWAFVTWRVRRSERERREIVLANDEVPAAGLREALLPHLAKEMKERLVDVLFHQRGSLLKNEDAASQRVADMEARLARLQPALAERIRGYETRIQALEKQLVEKDQETRDLIRAKLILARKELDAEISRSRIDWN